MENSRSRTISLNEAPPRQPRRKANAPICLCPCCGEIVAQTEPHLMTCFFKFLQTPSFQNISFSYDLDTSPKPQALPISEYPHPSNFYTTEPKKPIPRVKQESKLVSEDRALFEVLGLLKDNFTKTFNDKLEVPNEDYSPKPHYCKPLKYHLPPISFESLSSKTIEDEECNIEKSKSKPVIQHLNLNHLPPPGQHITISSAKRRSPRKTSPRSPRTLSSSLTHSKEFKNVNEESRERKNSTVDKVLDLIKEKRYTWSNPNTNSLAANPLATTAPNTDDFRKLKKVQRQSMRRDKQTPFNLPLVKADTSGSFDVAKLPIRTDVLSTNQLAEMYPEIDPTFHNVSNFPHNSRVAIVCLENNCFVRLTEDGRVLADTPTAASQQLDVHFKLKKYADHKRFKFKSVLWSKYLWHRVEFEELNDYLLVRYKRSFSCLYMDPTTSEVKLSLEKKSVFRVVKLFLPPENIVSSASHLGLINHLNSFDLEENENNSNSARAILTKQKSDQSTLKITR